MDCVDGDGGKRVVKLNQREAVPQSVSAEREHREDSYKAIAAAIGIAIRRRAVFALLVLTLSELPGIVYPVARDRDQRLVVCCWSLVAKGPLCERRKLKSLGGLGQTRSCKVPSAEQGVRFKIRRFCN